MEVRVYVSPSHRGPPRWAGAQLSLGFQSFSGGHSAEGRADQLPSLFSSSPSALSWPVSREGLSAEPDPWWLTTRWVVHAEKGPWQARWCSARSRVQELGFGVQAHL